MLSTTLVESFQIECITPYEVNQYIKRLAQMSQLVLMASGKLYLNKCRCNFPSIINKSKGTGFFHEKIMVACVFQIFKGGSKEDPYNYPPISILNTIYLKYLKNMFLFNFMTF